ncbi:retrovirus-related Pol polyprotein from transposon opus [Trichonephila clavipes]|nr:retrovirus-related Pol polyprotein from transposon opus [Trichonephila clavipes]
MLEFLNGIDKLLEIPSDLSCAYLKSHLLGRAQDWYQIFGSALAQNTATDLAQLKAALSKAFPAIRNKKDLEINFYVSHQRRNQEPTNFVYNLLKVITVQGAKCQNIRVVELNVRIRELEKPWWFHVLADLEYPCILGVNFISRSQIILDFDRKSLAIPDSQIDNLEGIKTDETKVRAIVEMKPSRNSKELSKFLGMSQWYPKFIKNYTDLCEPLYNLKRKLKKFCWSIEVQKALDAVKEAIAKALVLKLPDFKKPFELFTDANSIGVGAVLNQEQRPVVIASRTLSAAERNYTVTERECLAVVWALNKFRTYLGSLPIKVSTDHAALTHLMNGKNLSSRMIRWVLKLA